MMQPPATLHQQVAALPPYVLAVWRTRYGVTNAVDLEARALLDKEAVAVRVEGIQPDARTVWLRLTEKVVRVGSPPPELLAATALAGLVAGVRPQGFEVPITARPDSIEAE